jgi:5-methylcytosine-specific restriction endonuclease McrA
MNPATSEVSAANVENPVTSGATKVCGNCKLNLDTSQFCGRKASKDGLCRICKSCQRAYSQEYRSANNEKVNERVRARRAANPELFRKHSKRYYQSHAKEDTQRRVKNDRANPAAVQVRRHKHRAKASGCEGSFTAQEWTDLCARYDQRCAICGNQKQLTVDHIVPLSKNGSNWIENIQPLCRSCNSSKNNREVPT